MLKDGIIKKEYNNIVEACKNDNLWKLGWLAWKYGVNTTVENWNFIEHFNSGAEHTTFLALAIKNAKKLDTVNYLLSKGADPNAMAQIERQNKSPMGIACGEHSNPIPICDSLLKHGADINEGGKNQNTPLIATIYKSANNKEQLMENLKWFLYNNADVNRSALDETPLSVSAKVGSIECADVLLRSGADINGTKGITPLVEALKAKNSEMAGFLIDNGADVNKTVPYVSEMQGTASTRVDGPFSPLLLAARANDVGIVNKLLDKGANIDFKDANNATALTWACKEKAEDVAVFLIKKGGIELKAREYDYKGRSALDYARENKLDKVVDMLRQEYLKDKSQSDSLRKDIISRMKIEPRARTRNEMNFSI